MYCAWCGAPVPTISYAPCARCGRPTNGAQTAAPPASGGSNVVVIVIALLVGGFFVLAIIGILSAIAIPNLLTAMQRSKQKRTMADVRTIATAWEARATDVNKYTAAGAISAITAASNKLTQAQLSGALSPTYIKLLPNKDG